ncbi:hypothetical protein ACH0BF_24635 [Pseudobacillus sp. 179-B 2D1 NHS]|uniref:hypothetical protein n=1 Tax=Pseudobacillus sp. 179-B 2D1 NHS TaxID=3374292 RepID=UPI00387910D8
MKKFISVLMIVVIFVIVFNVYSNKDDVSTSNDGKTRSDRIASVLNTGFDEYGLFSFEIGNTDPTIRIVMDEAKSKQELQKYLKENVSKSDLNHYNIEILKRNLQEVEEEHTMLQIESIVFDYLEAIKTKNISAATKYADDLRFPDKENQKEQYSILFSEQNVTDTKIVNLKKVSETEFKATVEFVENGNLSKHTFPIQQKGKEWKIIVGQDV